MGGIPFLVNCICVSVFRGSWSPPRPWAQSVTADVACSREAARPPRAPPPPSRHALSALCFLIPAQE